MFKISAKLYTASFLSCLLILAGSSGRAAEPLDPTKYITIDEVRPGMEAYCLTTYKGTEIEKFDMEVLSVVRNIMPGRDAILVQGTDVLSKARSRWDLRFIFPNLLTSLRLTGKCPILDRAASIEQPASNSCAVR